MAMHRFKLEQVPRDIKAGIGQICLDHPSRFVSKENETLTLRFVKDAAMEHGALKTELNQSLLTVYAGDKSAAFRALGRLLSCTRKKDLVFEERTSFSMRGLMVDCSRNGVLSLDAAKAFMRRVSLMGVNMLMLYTEDTYEVPGEPFFGYLRGGFTRKEMRDLDHYAHNLGIELIPCIQTLGHLEQMLQWDPNFKYRDTANVLLAGDDDVYTLIRKLIRTASGNVRSRRIHVGMDEAHGLGSGRFKEKFGEKPPFEIMNAHLAKVRDICREEGVEPIIWSDMYFRLGSKNHSYYDMDWKIPQKIVKDIPKDVQLVYWDYYHADVETYRKMIGFHRKLGSEPLMGGGIWTWSHFWCALPWSFTAVDACMKASRQEGLKEVFMTLWGDDGMEVDIFSALPGIQYFCEHAFGEQEQDPMALAKRHFKGVCGSPMEPWVDAAGIDSNPMISQPEMSSSSIGRALLWQDPLLSVVDPVVGRTKLDDWYRNLTQRLRKAARQGGLSSRLAFPAAMSAVLEKKAHFRKNLSAAYRRKDSVALRRIVKRDLPELQDRVEALWKQHREMWMATYKPFGWEVLDCRYGGLMTRLETVRDRLGRYLNGELETLEELDATLRNPWSGIAADQLSFSYGKVKTPSCIK